MENYTRKTDTIGKLANVEMDRFSSAERQINSLMVTSSNKCKELDSILEFEKNLVGLDLVSSSMEQISQIYKMIEGLRTFPNLASVSSFGAKISDQLNFGSGLASVGSIGSQIPDYSKTFPNLASVSSFGAKFSDQLNFGSSLASVGSIGSQIPDYSKTSLDLASSAFAATNVADQFKSSSALARIESIEMRNSDIRKVDLDKRTNIRQISRPIKPTFPKRNEKYIKQIGKEIQKEIAKRDISEMLKLRSFCNDASIHADGEEIFKTTNKGSDALLDIAFLIPNDKMSFGNFIDNLYILFYEGAGGDNLRFLKDNEGVLEKDECEFIWCVKNLRNKWLRHDMDHGDKSKIKASRKTLRNAFNCLGLDHHPMDSEDFRYLHSMLVKEARKFLEAILEKINNCDKEK
jgi:hypothetical protein